MPIIQAVLFDADGVLQYPSTRWRPAFKELFSFDQKDLEDFTVRVAEIELSALSGKTSFEDGIASLLSDWGFVDKQEATLAVFNGIVSDVEVIRVVRRIRRNGVPCYIASNQQSNRARYMSESLDYGSIFTQEFYSCDIGFAKPSHEFFLNILNRLDVLAESVLFIDDVPEYVAAAQKVGLPGFVFHRDQGISTLRKLLTKFGLP